MNLVEVLKTGRAEIMRRWMAAVRAELTEMRVLPDEELRDSFPLILDRITNRLQGGERPPVMIEARIHAELRWQRRISFPTMMREYQLLLENIKVVAAESLRYLEPDQARTVDAVWFEAVEQSVLSYTTCKEAELVQTNEHRNRLLATLSHDVRTPLQSIVMTLALTEMKLGKLLDAEDLDHLNSVRASINQILDLHRGILDHSRLEAGRVVLEETTFALDPVLASCVQVVKPLANHKKLSMVEDLALGAMVRTDQAIVQQVMGNLLSNAVRYTLKGSITTRSRRTVDAICIEVEDTGVGIKAEDQSRIFDEFYQAGSPRNAPGGGFGLGLAIAWRLARLLGGTLTVASVPGKGSVFTLSLPLTIIA